MTAAVRSMPASRWSRNHVRKWIVSSTATPIATLATIIVPMSIRMPR